MCEMNEKVFLFSYDKKIITILYENKLRLVLNDT